MLVPLAISILSVCVTAFSPFIRSSRNSNSLFNQSTSQKMLSKSSTTPKYKVRPYNPNTDRSNLEEICENVYGGGDYLPKVAEMYVADPLCSFLALAVAGDEHQDEIVAVANYKRLPLQNSAWIEAVRTHPSHQNKGLASSLLRELIALSKEEDRGLSTQERTRILTCTIESNKGMQRALEKVGFVRYSTIPALSFAKLKQLPGWSVDCKSKPQPLIPALELDHLISPEAKKIASSNRWSAITSNDELLKALEVCKMHGGTCGYLPGLYEYIVPGPSRTDLQQSMEKGLVFSFDFSDKDISGCDENYDICARAGKAILAFTKDDRISSLKSQWVCSIVAYTGLAFEAALLFAHSLEVAKRMHRLQSKFDSVVEVDSENSGALPFCLVFDDATPLDDGTLAHALPRVTDECVVFSLNHIVTG